MAYPNPIKSTGDLSISGDIFDYFKKAFIQQQDGEGYSNPRWGYLYDSMTTLSYPFSIAEFWNKVTSIFPLIDGQPLYSFSVPQDGWGREAVQDWGKIKSIELALFGTDVSTLSTTLPYLSGGFPNTEQWKAGNIAYLRYALTRFEDYGTCISEEGTPMPTPTAPLSNTSARTFDWSWATEPGRIYNSLSDYEISVNGEDYITPTVKPFIVPDEIITHGEIRLRTKATFYRPASSIIASSGLYDRPRITLEVNANGSIDSFDIAFSLSGPLPNTLYIQATVYFTDNGIASSIPTGVTLPPGSGGDLQLIPYSSMHGGPVIVTNIIITSVTPNPNGSTVIDY